MHKVFIFFFFIISLFFFFTHFAIHPVFAANNCGPTCTGSCTNGQWCEADLNPYTCDAKDDVEVVGIYFCQNNAWQFKYNQNGSFNNGCPQHNQCNPDCGPCTVNGQDGHCNNPGGWCEEDTGVCATNLNVHVVKIYQCDASHTWQFKYNQNGSFNNGCPAHNTCSNISPAPSSRPVPSGTTSTPVPQGDSFVSLVVALPGIGGLHGGNPNPGSPTRSVTLSLYTPDQDPSNVNDKPILVNSTMHLDTTSGDQTFGYFINPKIDVGALNGDFQIFVKTNQDLRAQIIPSGNSSSDNTFHLTSGQVTNLPQVALLAGDIFPQPTSNSTSFGDNTIDISDYNMLISCYGGNANTSTCPSKSAADLNDDGVVDGIDYNILLRSFFTLQNQ